MIFKNQENWKWASEIISEHRNSDEYVFVEYLEPFCFYYNCDNKVIDFRNAHRYNNYNKVWIIYTHFFRVKLEYNFLKNFNNIFSVKKGNIRIFYYKK
ncbi:MAG: hypothetical protein N2114_01490, partial [Candidatus Goldbacteria bacterium]|nr:hypothetical protein [Candidatus Goldiibacteriota bacterium]